VRLFGEQIVWLCVRNLWGEGMRWERRSDRKRGGKGRALPAGVASGSGVVAFTTREISKQKNGHGKSTKGKKKDRKKGGSIAKKDTSKK